MDCETKRQSRKAIADKCFIIRYVFFDGTRKNQVARATWSHSWREIYLFFLWNKIGQTSKKIAFILFYALESECFCRFIANLFVIAVFWVVSQISINYVKKKKCENVGIINCSLSVPFAGNCKNGKCKSQFFVTAFLEILCVGKLKTWGWTWKRYTKRKGPAWSPFFMNDFDNSYFFGGRRNPKEMVPVSFFFLVDVLSPSSGCCAT